MTTYCTLANINVVRPFFFHRSVPHRATEKPYRVHIKGLHVASRACCGHLCAAQDGRRVSQPEMSAVRAGRYVATRGRWSNERRTMPGPDPVGSSQPNVQMSSIGAQRSNGRILHGTCGAAIAAAANRSTAHADPARLFSADEIDNGGKRDR
jgi:hypothetical protein